MSGKRVASAIARAKLWPWATIFRIAVVIGAVVIAVLIYRQLFVVPGQLRQEGAQSKQDTKAAQGEVTVTRATMDAMENRSADQGVVREIIRENTREIRSAAGSSDRVPPAVHDAFVASIERLRDQADKRDGASDRLPEADR